MLKFKKKINVIYFKLCQITNYKSLITPLALALSGCMGIYEGGFECPPGEGAKCKSISEVNELVNKGEIPKKVMSEDSSQPSPCIEGSDCSLNSSSSSSSSSSPSPLKGHPVASEGTIWYAPHTIEGSI